MSDDEAQDRVVVVAMAVVSGLETEKTHSKKKRKWRGSRVRMALRRGVCLLPSSCLVLRRLIPLSPSQSSESAPHRQPRAAGVGHSRPPRPGESRGPKG